jgi:hypothetical protein
MEVLAMETTMVSGMEELAMDMVLIRVEDPAPSTWATGVIIQPT